MRCLCTTRVVRLFTWSRKDQAWLGDLTELRASIAAYGVWQALTVVPEDDGHRIVAGHRRAAAAVEALEAGEWPDNLPQTVPCLVRLDMVGLAPEHIVAMLVENDQRVDLTESERAAGYAQLELFGLDVAEIAGGPAGRRSTSSPRSS
ncbi:ParB N-terminal domain-containing protein [Micromonospora sp. NPDC052213]|uniref:ParB/RepB/Spo0J family partition protein n=1 Tax=Micromonospora sp. NPDC052213 TaxID=3155812 RepID=UPI003421F96F